MSKKSIEIDEGTLSVSPFSYGIEIRAKRTRDNSKFAIDSDGVKMPDVWLYDAQGRTSLYHSKDCDAVYMLLSPVSLKLLLHIAGRMSAGKDWYKLNKDLFCRLAGVSSHNTYNKAVNELVRYCVIIGTHYKDVYWVNPMFMFNGDRCKKYPNNVKIISEREL